jgi:hypothetical protein
VSHRPIETKRLSGTAGDPYQGWTDRTEHVHSGSIPQGNATLAVPSKESPRMIQGVTLAAFPVNLQARTQGHLRFKTLYFGGEHDNFTVYCGRGLTMQQF